MQLLKTDLDLRMGEVLLLLVDFVMYICVNNEYAYEVQPVMLEIPEEFPKESQLYQDYMKGFLLKIKCCSLIQCYNICHHAIISSFNVQRNEVSGLK